MDNDRPKDAAAELRDKATQVLEELVGRGREFIDRHEATIDSTIDKVAVFVDEQTKRQYHDRIEQVAEKAKDTVGRLAADGG